MCPVLHTRVFVLKDWVHLEKHSHVEIWLKRRFECPLLGMDNVEVKTVQLGTDGCSRNSWRRLKEVHLVIWGFEKREETFFWLGLGVFVFSVLPLLAAELCTKYECDEANSWWIVCVIIKWHITICEALISFAQQSL